VAARRIFDDLIRTDPEPSRGEDSFSFLNRAATPFWERVRRFVDEAFGEYPAEHARDLRARFRDRRWPVHVGAWWELYLFTLFRALGAEVQVHPNLPGVASRPDFRLRIAGATIIVEARYVAAGLVPGERGVGRDDWITGPLDTLWHPNFMVRVRIVARGHSQPRRAAVTAGVLAWLDGLDPDEVAARPVHEFPRFSGHAGDWRFELEALPMKSEARSSRRRRLVAIFPSDGGWDNTVTALRAGLKEKAGKYGRPNDPFIIAPLLTSGFVSAEDVFSALFGSEVVTFTTDAPESARLHRRGDGFWRSGSGFRGTRVSGVLIGSAVMPWTAAAALPRLWTHPAAAHPLTVDLTLPTATIGSEGVLVLSLNDRSGADVFGLDPRWPGPEPPFP
jgi:hypothetical protein